MKILTIILFAIASTASPAFAQNPVFTASPSTIAFGTVNVNSSNIRTFTIQGSNFSNNLVITAPTGFSLSIAQNGTFAQSIIISPVNTLIQNTVIYVRFLPTQTGAFSGTITQTSGSITLTPITVSGTAQVASSVRFNESHSFSVFPNPASHLLSVQFPSLESPEIRLSICNTLGQRLSIAQIQAQRGSFRTELDISHLNAGMYILVAERVSAQGAKRETMTFLKY